MDRTPLLAFPGFEGAAGMETKEVNAREQVERLRRPHSPQNKSFRSVVFDDAPPHYAPQQHIAAIPMTKLSQVEHEGFGGYVRQVEHHQMGRSANVAEPEGAADTFVPGRRSETSQTRRQPVGNPQAPAHMQSEVAGLALSQPRGGDEPGGSTSMARYGWQRGEQREGGQSFMDNAWHYGFSPFPQMSFLGFTPNKHHKREHTPLFCLV